MADYLDKDGLSYFWEKIKAIFATKQDTLVSGENIKTINNNSLLGSGNLDIEGGVTGVKGNNESTYRTGDVNLTPANLGAQEELVSGTNIKTVNNTSLLGSGNIDVEGVPHVNLTQAEYDALTPAQKDNGDIYFITDGDDTAYSGIIGSGELATDAKTLVGAVNELDADIKQQKKIYRFDVTSNTSVSANNLVVWNSGYTSDNSVYLTSNGKGIKFNKAGRVAVNVHIAGNTGSAGRLWCVLQGGNYNVQGITYGAYSSVDLFAVFDVTTSFELSVKFIEAFTLCSGGTGPCVFSVTYL